jgi:acetyltransferase-like isoleucine patch superfamily enzyme
MTALRPGFLARLFGHTQSASAWTIEGSTLRFTVDHEGAIALRVHDTLVTVKEGVRIGRGTRFHLLGGSLEIGADAVLGESVDIRAAGAVTIGARAVIDDFAQLQADGVPLTIGESVRVGRFTRLWSHNGPVALGAETTIGPSCTFIGTGRGIAIAPRCDFTHAVTLDSAGGSIEMASGSGVGPNSVLYGHGGLRIGSGVAIAGLTMIVPANHRYDRSDIPMRQQGIDASPIEIGDHVWVGAGVVVLAGSRVGLGAVIGAGAVVRGEVAPRSVVAGVPARDLAGRGTPGIRQAEPRVAADGESSDRTEAQRAGLPGESAEESAESL